MSLPPRHAFAAEWFASCRALDRKRPAGAYAALLELRGRQADKDAGEPWDDAPVPCPRCGGRGYALYERGNPAAAEPCGCQEGNP